MVASAAWTKVSIASTTELTPWLLPVLVIPLFTSHRGLLATDLIHRIRTDDKTGLATCAHWHAEAARLLARAGRRHHPASVLMIDLDHFKTVNDTYGHLAGDQVLRAAAAAITDQLEPRDLAGRFGGEEFVVLLPDATTTRAHAVAQTIRGAVEALTVPVHTATSTATSTTYVGALTVSIGTATRHTPASTAPASTAPVSSIPTIAAPGELDALLLDADAALYGAKRAGRNRVHHAHP